MLTLLQYSSINHLYIGYNANQPWKRIHPELCKESSMILNYCYLKFDNAIFILCMICVSAHNNSPERSPTKWPAVLWCLLCVWFNVSIALFHMLTGKEDVDWSVYIVIESDMHQSIWMAHLLPKIHYSLTVVNPVYIMKNTILFMFCVSISIEMQLTNHQASP